MSNYVRNPLVPWLLSHAYGQGGTVAVPAAAPAAAGMPRGEFPAGIPDVLQHVAGRHAAWSASGQDDIHWCLLVGGPGNGKSEALRTLASVLGVQLPARQPGQQVPRAIPTSWPATPHPLASGLGIVFVNDASIPRADALGAGSPGSLFQDVADAAASLIGRRHPIALFANVNRGILVEEAAALAHPRPTLASHAGTVASEIIRWLAQPPVATVTGGLVGSVTPAASPTSVETVVTPGSLTPHYGQFRVRLRSLGAAQDVVVHVVFLDVLSLLEPTPGGGDPSVDFGPTRPVIGAYQTLGNLVSHEPSRDETTAGKLVSAFAENARWEGGGCRGPSGELCAAFRTCPFAQNASWLQDSTLRQRTLDALRAAEVAAGRRFTYRDLLGHVSLALLGEPEESWLTGTHPCDWSAAQKQAVEQRAAPARAATLLVGHRVYVNLFPPPDPEAWRRSAQKALSGDTMYHEAIAMMTRSGEAPRVPAFDRAFNQLDPARDTEPWAGLRIQTLDAVEALGVELPAVQLRGWTEIPAAANSEIELIVDELVQAEVAAELEQSARREGGSRAANGRVRLLRKWRSTLMLRQVGLAMGRLSFGPSVQAWLAEQENALRGGSRLGLGDGIQNLIIPGGTGGRVFLAPLRPRTYCLASGLPPNTLLIGINVNDLRVEVVPHGDNLLAEVQMVRGRENQPLASLVIDLAVAREAILHSATSERSFTEIGDTAFARIERARASLISRERMRSGTVFFTDAAETMYRLSVNPAGTVTLRAQRAQEGR